MSNNNQTGWTIIIILFIIGAILTAFTPTHQETNPTYTKEEKAGYEYSKNRLKQEGYSDKEAEQAAKAILKYHQQKNK